MKSLRPVLTTLVSEAFRSSFRRRVFEESMDLGRQCVALFLAYAMIFVTLPVQADVMRQGNGSAFAGGLNLTGLGSLPSYGEGGAPPRGVGPVEQSLNSLAPGGGPSNTFQKAPSSRQLLEPPSIRPNVSASRIVPATGPSSSASTADEPAPPVLMARNGLSRELGAGPLAGIITGFMPKVFASTSGISIFGPVQYNRTTGPPNQYTATFLLPASVSAPFQLQVQNGDGNGGHRISSGTITINGVQVVGTSDFNQNVATIIRTVTLASTNTLAVTLASNPGSYIILNIGGIALPTANAGPNQTVPVGTQVQLDGTASTDPNGYPLTYQWTILSRPTGSVATLSSATAPRPTFQADKVGAYSVRLVVNDGYASSAASTVSITSQSSTPTANAGPPQTVYTGATVQLDGSGSSDPAGLPLSYSWSFLTRPSGSTAALNSATLARPTFVADKAGSYKLQLIVNNGYNPSTPATVVITSQTQPPVAIAGPGQTVFVAATVHLDGTGSYDPAALPLTYQWSFVSKPAGSAAVLTGATTATPTFLVDKAGAYVVQLIVNNGVYSSAASTVSISTQNSPPVANAGPNQTVKTHVTVQLDGSASSDADGNPLTYLWSLVSKPVGSVAVLSSPSVVNPTFVTDLKGNYVAQLVVNDGQVNSTPATVTISTVNTTPVANAGPDQSITVNQTVQLTGSGSTDVDGDALSYSWTFISRPTGSSATLSNPNAVNPTFIADVLGTYVLQLVVNDGTANSTPSTVNISSGDVAPVANAGPAQSVTLGTLVTLDGTASTDSNQQPLIYHWSILSKPANSAAALSLPTSAHPYFTVDLAGNYVVQLIVNDGFLDSTAVAVTISTVNSVPVANPGPSQAVIAGTNVQLSGATSTDADSDPLTYKWAILTQPAGGTAVLSSTTLVNPTFVPNVAGTYVVQLIVNDGKVNSLPATLTVTATPANQPPAVDAGGNQSTTLPTNSVTLNGTATDDGLPNNTLVLNWSVVSGPGTVTFSSPNTAMTQATFTVAGTYVLRLTANDSLLSTSDTATITVNPQLNQAPVVNPGANRTIALPTNSVMLNGTVTDDGLPTGTLQIAWTTLSGPGTVTFSSANSAATQATFSAVGTYLLQLAVSDSQLSSSATVAVVLLPAGANQPPVVSAGPNQTITFPTTTLTLNGSVTDDGLPNNTLTSSWTQVSGPGSVGFSSPGQPVTQA